VVAIVTGPVDFDRILTETGALVTRLEALVRQACDRKGASMQDRREAAMAACELIADSGALRRLEQARQWAKANRVHLERAQKAAAFFDVLRGR